MSVADGAAVNRFGVTLEPVINLQGHAHEDADVLLGLFQFWSADRFQCRFIDTSARRLEPARAGEPAAGDVSAASVRAWTVSGLKAEQPRCLRASQLMAAGTRQGIDRRGTPLRKLRHWEEPIARSHMSSRHDGVHSTSGQASEREGVPAGER